MVCMLVMMSSVLLSVDYLHYMSCRHRLPLHAVSSTRCPFEFLLYPMALMMYILRCGGRLCSEGRLVGIIVGCCVAVLSFCIPSWV